MSGGSEGPGGGLPPRILRVFPLSGVLLLPRGRLPLNIFEPRYLNMTADALGGDRIIGMIQPRHPDPGLLPDDAAIYDTGCAGRLTSFSESDDGRNLITLSGVCRFRVVKELEPVRGYRRVEADYRDFEDDLGEAAGRIADRPGLVEWVRAYFALKGVDIDWKAIETTDDNALVAALAMVCPLEPGEKQALLESPGLAERAALLAGLLEMAVSATGGAARATAH